MRLDDNCLTGLDAVNLRILVLSELVVDAAVIVVYALLMLGQRVFLLDQAFRGRFVLALFLQVNITIESFDDSGQLGRGAAAAVDHLFGEPIKLTLDRFGLLAQDTTAHAIGAGASELVVQVGCPGRFARGVVDCRSVDNVILARIILHQA